MIAPAAALPVMLVDDDADLRRATGQLLTLAGHDVRPFAGGEAALAAIDADFPGVVVTDVRMPGLSGIDLFRAIHALDRDLPVILVTGHGDVEMAVGLLKAGAWDFLTKPFSPDALLAAVARGGAARTLTIENRRLRGGPAGSPLDDLVGRSAALRDLRATIPLIADTDLDVVVEGETGTGKQLVARLIHRLGRRGRHRFVSVDCATLPPSLAERDLLAAHGIVSRAHRGTLFLDNLDRADQALQYRLSAFAEQRAVALDARDPDPVDTRIVAAVAEGGRDRVLPSLYHRLAAVTLRLPPLSERGEDVPLLFGHFTARAAEQHGRPAPPLADAAHLLSGRAWPGNVRELEMAAERFVLGVGDTGPAVAAGASLPDRLRAYERSAILEAIAQAGGEVARAIEILRIPRETFYYRVKRLGIDLKRARGG